VRETETALEEAKGRESIARRDASDARVHPPLSGVAQARHVVVGQWVNAGTPIATLVDTSRLRLRFRVPEEASVAMVAGKVAVSFRVAAIPGRALSARLLYVQSSADPTTRMVECLAEVAEPDPALKPGFFASVTVDVGSDAAAVVVPEEAVLATERGLVSFLVADGKAKSVPVRLGLRTKDGWVEVLEGIPAGAAVTVENAHVLDDGAAVETFPSARTAGSGGAAPAPPPTAGGGR
jgi:multidrug efflux system membrane fusion protein